MANNNIPCRLLDPSNMGSLETFLHVKQTQVGASADAAMLSEPSMARSTASRDGLVAVIV